VSPSFQSLSQEKERYRKEAVRLEEHRRNTLSREREKRERERE